MLWKSWDKQHLYIHPKPYTCWRINIDFMLICNNEHHSFASNICGIGLWLVNFGQPVLSINYLITEQQNPSE